MRIGCVQFAPQVGQVDANMRRATEMLEAAAPRGLHLLVLPEMAFSGYAFKSLRQIEPWLEPTGKGVSADWARTAARQYDCAVAVGYAEKADDSRNYNALIVVGADGATCAHYRKSQLYDTDETWASEGSGFFAGELPGFGTTAIGICMDINPYKFRAPFEAYEFATHARQVAASLVVVAMAWNTFDMDFHSAPDEPDVSSLAYWVQRMAPLREAGGSQETIVVFANRCGVEDETVYTGTSAVVGVLGDDMRLYGLLSRGQSEVLVVDTSTSPLASLMSVGMVPSVTA